MSRTKNNKPPADSGGEENPRAALVRAQTRAADERARELALRNQERRGELIEVATVAREYAEHVGRCRARLLAVPSKVAQRIAALTDPARIENVLRVEIESALRELAD